MRLLSCQANLSCRHWLLSLVLLMRCTVQQGVLHAINTHQYWWCCYIGPKTHLPKKKNRHFVWRQWLAGKSSFFLQPVGVGEPLSGQGSHSAEFLLEGSRGTHSLRLWNIGWTLTGTCWHADLRSCSNCPMFPGEWCRPGERLVELPLERRCPI